MISKLEKKVVENTNIIEDIILKYFLKKLEVNEVNTINTLITNNKFTFSNKINLFCDLIHMSTIDVAKFKVYTKINNEVILNNDSLKSDYFKNLNTYYPFLINTYLATEDVISNQQKLTFAINLLIDDVVKLTKDYTEKPQTYFQKKVKNIFSV